MIQLILDSAGKMTSEWENEQERLVFRVSGVNVVHANLLHGRLDEAGTPVPETESVGMITLLYDGNTASQARIILELSAEQWDTLADRADDLLD